MLNDHRHITFNDVINLLTDAQAELLRNSLKRIEECEHGIPRTHWCARCESLYASVVEHAIVWASANEEAKKAGTLAPAPKKDNYGPLDDKDTWGR